MGTKVCSLTDQELGILRLWMGERILSGMVRLPEQGMDQYFRNTTCGIGLDFGFKRVLVHKSAKGWEFIVRTFWDTDTVPCHSLDEALDQLSDFLTHWLKTSDQREN